MKYISISDMANNKPAFSVINYDDLDNMIKKMIILSIKPCDNHTC
jgi:hypothetical protein